MNILLKILIASFISVISLSVFADFPDGCSAVVCKGLNLTVGKSQALELKASPTGFPEAYATLADGSQFQTFHVILNRMCDGIRYMGIENGDQGSLASLENVTFGRDNDMMSPVTVHWRDTEAYREIELQCYNH